VAEGHGVAELLRLTASLTPHHRTQPDPAVLDNPPAGTTP